MTFNQKPVRHILVESEPWVQSKYVANMWEHTGTKTAIAKPRTEYDRQKCMNEGKTPQTTLDHNAKNAVYINESILDGWAFGTKHWSSSVQAEGL